MSYVNQSVQKKDAKALVTGQPVYTDDIAPADCLIVKVLRSPHAHAMIEEIKTDTAKKVPGIACILTYEDVPQERFTMAGQTYPELSPYDRLILDKHLRFVGDAVAIVAGENEKAVDKALKLIKVKYEILEPVLDFHKAKDCEILIHPEENWEAKVPVGADNHRNLCASGVESKGDVEALLKECKYVVEGTYHTKANQQAMMETFRAYTYLDHFGRLNVVASTQVPFHIRRILGRALGIGASKVRVIKPRIGGGFGAKQTSVAEVYPAIVTLKTGKPAKMIFSRYESQICSSPRHEMEVKVRLGADEKGLLRAIDIYTLSNTGAYGEHGPTTVGQICSSPRHEMEVKVRLGADEKGLLRAIDIYTLSNTGAYGEHGPTTVGLSAHKPLGLYRNTQAYRFTYDVVYTNHMSAGAYRGYGATQGIFAVESAIDELAEKIGMNPIAFRELNVSREGDAFVGYDGSPVGATQGIFAVESAIDELAEKIGMNPIAFRELNVSREGDAFVGYDGSPVVTSCTLDKCIEKAKEMIGWDKKYPCCNTGDFCGRVSH